MATTTTAGLTQVTTPSITTDKALYASGDTVRITYVRPTNPIVLSGSGGALPVVSVTIQLEVAPNVVADKVLTPVMDSDDGTTWLGHALVP